MAPPTMKLANRSNVYTSMSIVFDNRENCKQCQPSLNGLVSTGVYYSRHSQMKHIFIASMAQERKVFVFPGHFEFCLC